MKIFIVINNNPYLVSSASANRWLTLIEGLAELGVQIKLLIYGGYQSEIEARSWRNEGEKNGIRYTYIATGVITGYLKTRYYAYIGNEIRKQKLFRSIIERVVNENGIIWTDATLFGFQLAVKIKKELPGKQLFLEMSEFLDIHKYNKGYFWQRWFAGRRQKYFEKKVFHFYDGLALMTKTLFNFYASFPAPKPALLNLPMTVDLKRFNGDFSPLPEFKKPYIVFVGVMNDAKEGVNILIEAFYKIHLQYPEYKLYLVGACNYDTPTHLKMIKDLKLSDKVFWMKEYPKERIPAIIKNADLLVLPRPDSKQARGGFPTKLGEYLASGNPVCCTKVGEIPCYLVDGESVFFAEPGSVDSFAKAMNRALSNPVKARQVGENGRRIAEKYFNKDIQAKILYDFFFSDLSFDKTTQQHI